MAFITAYYVTAEYLIKEFERLREADKYSLSFYGGFISSYSLRDHVS